MTHPLRHLVAMSTAGLLFVGGVAAAATGSNPLSPLLGANEDAAPLVTTTTTTLPASETSPDSETAGDALTFEEVCEDAENHGEAVSTVAKDKTTVGAEHGAAVSEMAKSDCGKTDDDDEEVEAEEPEDTPTFEEICEAAENHGEAVSTVAKDKTTVGAEHGAAVSEMAKSDCGKTDDDDDEEEEEERDAPAAASKSAKNNSRHNDDGDDEGDDELGS